MAATLVVPKSEGKFACDAQRTTLRAAVRARQTTRTCKGGELGGRAQCRHGAADGGRGVKGAGPWAGGTMAEGGIRGPSKVCVLRQRSPNVNFALQEKWVRAGKEGRGTHSLALLGIHIWSRLKFEIQVRF
jgi:hypothetical protein